MDKAVSTEIKRQLQIGAATTAGAAMGVVLASRTGWNKTLTIAASSFVGLAAGISLGLIKSN